MTPSQRAKERVVRTAMRIYRESRFPVQTFEMVLQGRTYVPSGRKWYRPPYDWFNELGNACAALSRKRGRK